MESLDDRVVLITGAAGGIGSRLTEPREHAMRLFERV